jgi:two-component system response regulator DevR
MSITVLLADDNKSIRNAIAQLLRGTYDIQIVGEASSLAQAMELASKLRPQVVVLDPHMSDEYSVTHAQIQSGFTGSRLVAMSIWNDEETKAVADSIGAVALLDKTALSTELIPAIRNCVRVQKAGQSSSGSAAALD